MNGEKKEEKKERTIDQTWANPRSPLLLLQSWWKLDHPPNEALVMKHLF